MGFFEKVVSFFSATPTDMETLGLYVRCDKCGEAIGTRIHLRHDVSPRYGKSGQGAAYFVRKTLVGSKRCFQPIEVELTFDADRKVIAREITGGQFITEEEYEAEER
ncbi:MAG: hypothetical protein ACETWR_24375 [Anaerolineae bacterium]